MKSWCAPAVCALLLGLSACRSTAGGAIQIDLRPAASQSQPASIRVTGLSGAELSALRSASFAEEQWEALLAVGTGGTISAERPAVKGKYTVGTDAVTFTPLFPFDPGRDYHVTFDPARLPNARPGSRIIATVRVAATVSAPTSVVGVYPRSTTVPENLLRMYVEFSAPMGSSGGLDFVRLVDRTDGRDQVVDGAFLPIEADFWSPDHKRYTLLFDPGRVKQDIFPNRVSGRPLRAGRKYALVISAEWPDANRRPLTSTYRHEFEAGPLVDSAITLADWKVAAPRANTLDPLVVTFSRALDHAIVMRALGVESSTGPIAGSAAPEANDTRWTFVPAARWQTGNYRLSAQSFLEDPQGNQIDRPFEEAVDAPKPEEQPETFRVPFVIPAS